MSLMVVLLKELTSQICVMLEILLRWQDSTDAKALTNLPF
jgi:hypothetical protein